MPMTMTSTVGIEPGTQTIVNRIAEMARSHPEVVEVITGTSVEGRPLQAVMCNDATVADETKQHAYIIAGRHGNEESGRIIALALLDWLLDGAGRRLLAHLTIAVVPNANPDACERDGYRHPSGPDVGGDLGAEAPLPESLFLEAIADRFHPDLVMDLHACGHVGCTHDMVLYPEPRRYTEDHNMLHSVAEAMCAAAELSGIPQLTHPMRWWDEVDHGVCARLYRRYKSLAFLTETAESNGPNHPLRLRIASGLAKVRVGLEIAAKKHPKLAFLGYPTDLVIGSYHLGIVAVGATAAERRSSRVAIWEQADHFVKVGPMNMPQLDRKKCIEVTYTGPPITTPVGIQLQTRHRSAPSVVKLNGVILQPGETSGYRFWRYRATSFVMAMMDSLQPGSQCLEVEF
jgi:hypothetical protein